MWLVANEDVYKRQTTGSVPEFWTWLNNLTNTNKQNVFAYMSKSLITNSGSIPEQWATNMRD